jgi:Mn-dependent DtxR family transcriptional regulator
LAHDRVGDGELPLTQDRLARLMGVRREAVTMAAGSLQRAGLIRYRRGKVVVADRGRLDRAACQCYREIYAEYVEWFATAKPRSAR